MNKIFNTVWNESTGMWVVTSELTRKGGQRPPQIKRTVLAGLIAGLLMPSMPAQAAYENQTVNSGSTLTVGAGNSAINTIVNSGGELNLSGGTSTDTIVNSGSELIRKGSTATGTVLNGGSQRVNSGGTAINTTVNSGGWLYTSGKVSGATVNTSGRLQAYDDAVVTNTIVDGGWAIGAAGNKAPSFVDTIIQNGGRLDIKGDNYTSYKAATATGTTINSGGVMYLMSGGSAANTTVNSGGRVSMAGSLKEAVLTQTTINDGGILQVNTKGKAQDTTINSGGLQTVNTGGSAISTTVHSGGVLQVSAGGSASLVTQNHGGAVVTNTSAVMDGTNQNGSFSIAGGSASNMLLENGGSLTVLDGHQATGTTINSGGNVIVKGNATDTTINEKGLLHVSSGGSVTGTIVNNGGRENINSGGSATSTSLNSGGVQAVSGGGVATSTIVNSGGNQYVYSGGNALNASVNNGGRQFVSAGGIATDTSVNSGGRQYISVGGSATGTTINDNGRQFVSSGASVANTTINADGKQYLYGGNATNTTINNGGRQYVSSGGSATNTTVHSGGRQHVYIDGNVTETTIASGGMLQVEAGGSASKVTQNSGGAVVTNTSAVLSGTNDKGTFSISGGSAANMLLENGGYLTVFGGHQASDTMVGSDGTLDVRSGGVLYGTTTLTDKGTLVGDVVTNEGNLFFLNNTAAAFTGSLTGSGTLTQEGGNTRFSGLLSQDGGIALKNGGAMTMDVLQAKANVTTQSGTTLTLDNGSILTGNVAGESTGAGDMTVKGASVWHLDGDSTVGALTLDNGTVDFRPSTTTRLTPVFRAVSLALDTLSGNGTFRMNTDIASHTGDMLKVTGNASGNFVLDIKNTGREPVSAGAPLQVVQTGGGDAAFTLNGGKVDAGTWEYGLSKENTNWYLKADTPPPVTPPTNPDAGNPGAGNPGVGKPDAGTSSSPERRTTKSADAILGMATVPAYVFNSELDNLRFRHGDVMQNTRAPGGVWGRYTGSDNRISGGASSGYTLTQNGFETGADKVFDLGESSLAVGAFFSYSDNSIKHARGGKSKVDSTGGGLYATWFDNDGYYVDGVLKYNRFDNELRTWMSDGTAVKGNYSQNGFGGSLEAGRVFSLNENTWAQPYLRTTAFKADAKDISLNNGMKAKAGATKSVQAEAGVKLGMSLDVGGKEVKPYLSAAVSHEFSDNNKVRINDTYDFRNDISGTTGKYGVGVSAQLTPNAGVWAEARYENGKQTESPITASVGFRFNF
ncbi:autotransporter outer membrane beta-barrel domain-containing protein [Citrobacter freundii]|nr:autotransporter outer membrane beta-barrel domain-containing protein [Citrobacter freundii]